MRPIIISVCLLFLLVPLWLRQADFDYLIAAGLIGVVIAACILTWRLPITWFDFGWLVALAFAVPQVAFALAAGARLSDVAFQSLIFFMPIAALAARFNLWRPTGRQIMKFVLLVCAVKAVAYLPYAEEFVRALTSTGERYRFHDLSGIVVCLFLVGCLAAGLFKSWGSRAVAGVSAVLLMAAAAHRSLYLAVSVQLVIAVLVSGTSRQRQTAIIAAVCIVVVTYMTPFGQVIVDLFSASLSGSDGNTNARISLSEAVWNSAFEFPFGHGLGGYFMFGVDSDNDLVTYAIQHNSYLTYLYYLGWIPFASMVVGSIATIVYTRPQTKYDVAMKSAFIGMSVFAYFNMFLESPIYAVFYWLVFGNLTLRPSPLDVEAAKDCQDRQFDIRLSRRAINA